MTILAKNKLYPWQIATWDKLNQRGARLPHALLLHGRSGIGKYDFALHLSRGLLCVNKDSAGHACNACASCYWFDEGSHPDFRILTPEQESEPDEEATTSKKTKKRTQISITQIRELADFLSLTSHRSNGLRIVLLHPAESLNIASANALLKMLEEPAEGVIFMLVSHQIQRLLPTILSRCQKIAMPVPAFDLALKWLSEQSIQNAAEQLTYLENSPIKVLNEQAQLAQIKEVWRFLALGNKLEPHLVAPVVISNSAETGIIALQKWIYDIVAMRLTKQVHYHVAMTKTFQALAEKVHLSRVFDLQKNINELRKLALHPLNHELQMECLLVEYTKIFKN